MPARDGDLRSGLRDTPRKESKGGNPPFYFLAKRGGNAPFYFGPFERGRAANIRF